MKVLVTGATGFLGSHLAAALVERGDTVTVLSRKNSKTDRLPQGVNIVYGDLADEDTLRSATERVDVVYHAAAAMRGSWQDFQQSTIDGTARMLRLSLDAGVKRFVHISSLVVYQVYQLEKNSVVTESCPRVESPERYGPYTRSKVEAEKLAFQFHQKGLPVVVVRPGVVYGPSGKVLLPHVGYPLRRKLFVIIGSGDNLLPLTYIDNTVDAILLAGTREEAIGHAYHIVDDVEITQREYLQRFMTATQSKFFVMSVPISLLFAMVALIEPLRALGKSASWPSKYGLASKWKSLKYDTSKAQRELHWHPRLGLEEGLKRTFQWYSAERLARLGMVQGAATGRTEQGTP